jgi:hypothetical protein
MSTSKVITHLDDAARYGVMPVHARATPFILVKISQQYGQRVLHPANENAELFCSMLSTKTITPRMVDHIKKLGYEVRVVQDLPEVL